MTTSIPAVKAVDATDERALFEAAARRERYNLTRSAKNTDDYAFPSAGGAWWAWQARAALSTRAAAQPTDFLMPEDAWSEYATRSGLLSEHGVAPDPAKTQTAYFAYQAAWNRLHKAFSDYIASKRWLVSGAPKVQPDLVKTESGWLIEKGDSFAPLYRTIDLGMYEWTADNMKAIRFCRRMDADMFAAEDPEDVRICEHVWMGDIPAGQAPAGVAVSGAVAEQAVAPSDAAGVTLPALPDFREVQVTPDDKPYTLAVYTDPDMREFGEKCYQAGRAASGSAQQAMPDVVIDGYTYDAATIKHILQDWIDFGAEAHDQRKRLATQAAPVPRMDGDTCRTCNGAKVYGTPGMPCTFCPIATQAATVTATAEAGDALDAARFREAIALEDSADTLLAAVLNNAPDGVAIRAEFDAAIKALAPEAKS